MCKQRLSTGGFVGDLFPRSSRSISKNISSPKSARCRSGETYGEEEEGKEMQHFVTLLDCRDLHWCEAKVARREDEHDECACEAPS